MSDANLKFNKYIIQENATILQAMKVINETARGIVFVCKGNKLIFAISDGDIRRYIMNEGKLDACVTELQFHHPYYLNTFESAKAAQLASELSIQAIPIVNSEFEIVDIYFDRKIQDARRQLNIPVVIMAGGKGLRLRPYTDILPKPLIPIGDKTIIERIIDRFFEYSCDNINVIINYKKELIKAYFLDNEAYKDITLIEESKYLGTGGGIKLISGLINETFFLTNCDILVNIDYADIFKYHKDNGCLITLVCAKKNMVVPYGTVEISENGLAQAFCEKPEFFYNVNTGFYVIEPRFCDFIPENQFIHITDIILLCIEKGERVGVYSIDDDAWMDMGQLEELDNMKSRLGM